MLRYFVAIPLPDSARDRLIAVQPPAVQGMRLPGRDEFHLTLHFLGEVTVHEIDAVRAALAKVKMNPFAVAIKGIGTFPPGGQPQVLWAGVEANSELTALHRAIAAVLGEAIGFRPEDRTYSPHVTLARLNEAAPPGVIEHYLQGNTGFMVSPVLLDRFALYSSAFSNNVPRYREEVAFILDLPASSPGG